jgi:hypothetical protein
MTSAAGGLEKGNSYTIKSFFRCQELGVRCQNLEVKRQGMEWKAQGARTKTFQVIWPLDVAVTTLRCQYAFGVIYGH